MCCKGGWQLLFGMPWGPSWFFWIFKVNSTLILLALLIPCQFLAATDTLLPTRRWLVFFFLSHLFRLCRLLGNRSQGLSPLNQTPWTSSRANCAAWAILRSCGYASLREWAKMTSSLHLLCTCLTKTVAFYPCHYLHFLLTLPYLIARELREKIQPEILELIKQQRLNRLCEGSSFRKIGNRRRQGKVTVSTVFFHVKNCSK